MKYKKTRIEQIVGILGSLLVISSCCLFRSPKDPNQIQNPPPTDRNYLACRVNGKPVVFKSLWKWASSSPSYFEVLKDTTNSKSLIKIELQGGNTGALENAVELYVSKEINFDDSLYKAKDVTQAKLKKYYNHNPSPSIHLYTTKYFNLIGTIQISHFNYAIDPKTDKPRGRISGAFKLKSTPSGATPDDLIEITDGVFNVTLIRDF